MKPSLVPFLRCPVSGEPLQLAEAHLGAPYEIDSGRLVSTSGRAYAIERGVPVLLDPAMFAPGQAETRASFSEKWQRAPNYREDTKAHYVSWYLERYGYGDLAGLRRFLAPKQRILDAGTGHGRDAQLYAENAPHAGVVGLDLSAGIHVAYAGLHHLPNLHLVQADLTRAPFAPGSFDFVACDQVVHHTPDTRRSLEALLKLVAPGGHLAFYVYKVKGPIREFCDDWLRARTTQMSVDECLAFSEAMTHLGRSLSEAHVEIEVPVDIPLLEIKAGRYDLQRFLYWNVFKMYWNAGQDWTSNVVTNFDWYHPLHAHRHTPDEVRAWCAALGLQVEHFDVVESGISVLARRV